MVALGVSAATGDSDGRTRVAVGSTTLMRIHASGPDVLLCGVAPDFGRTVDSVDFFGRTAAAGGRPCGFAVALGPDFSGRWLETVVGTEGGAVDACAPAPDGTAWASGSSIGTGMAVGPPSPCDVLARPTP